MEEWDNGAFTELFPDWTEPPRPDRVNPCIGAYGYGPKDKTCKTCSHLVTKRYANTYYKCNQRKMTSGAATDHRVRWKACGRYKEESNGTR